MKMTGQLISYSEREFQDRDDSTKKNRRVICSIMIPADDPSEGFQVMQAFLDPADFDNNGRKPDEYPCNCEADFNLQKRKVNGYDAQVVNIQRVKCLPSGKGA